MKKITSLKKKILNMMNECYTFVSYSLPWGYALPPTTVHLELTLRCNLRCKMCFFYGEHGKPPSTKNEFSTEDIKSILDEISDAYRFMPFKPQLSLTGGEIFMRGDIFEILGYMKKKRFKFSIVSNFALLDKSKVNKLLEIGPGSLNISIDGPKKVHDAIRNVPGTYEKAVSALRYLREKDKKLPIVLNCVPTLENHSYIHELVDLAKEIDAKLQFGYLNFLDMKHKNAHKKVMKRYFGKEYDITSDIKTFSLKQAEAIAKSVNETRKKAEKKGVLVGGAPYLREDEVKDFYYDLGFIHARKCRVPWAKLRINSCGDVHPCPIFFEYNFGNIKKEHFKDLINNRNAREFRKVLKKNGIFPGCIRCCWL